MPKQRNSCRLTALSLLRWLDEMRSQIAEVGHLFTPRAVESIARELALAGKVLEKHVFNARNIQAFMDRGGRLADVVDLAKWATNREPDLPADPHQLKLWRAS